MATAANHIQLDKTSPGNNGIAFVTPTSSTSMSITANVATDTNSGLAVAPYWFSSVGGASGTDWQSSEIFTDSGLSPNTLYGYKVKSKDAAGNTTDYSSVLTKYTLANVPTTPILTADSVHQITASWSANGNPDGTQYYIENTTNSANSGWITATSWVSSVVTCGTDYSFRLKARNADLTETDWSTTAIIKTNSCGGGLPAGACSFITRSSMA